MKPLVSVIIPTYNNADYVQAAIESVLKQTYDNLEIIVIDDGSTDSTRDVVDRFKEKIRYIYQPNQGSSVSRNRGIKEARGDFVAFLDADDIWLPEKMEKQMRLFERRPDLHFVACHGNIILKNGKTIEVRAPKFKNKKRFHKALINVNYFCGSPSNMVIRKHCFDEAGLFDESLIYAEDWDMWLRMVARFEFDYVPEKLVVILHANPSRKNSVQNAGDIFNDEMRVVNKFFNNNTYGFKLKSRLWRKAYAYRLNQAAWSYLTSGNIRQGRYCILGAIRHYPFLLFRRRQHVLLAGLFLKQSSKHTSSLVKDNKETGVCSRSIL